MNDLFTKIALVFPGVGAQHPGMAKSFYDNFGLVKNTFEEASDVLKEDLKKICFSDKSSELLRRTDICQLALVTVNISIFRVFEQEIGIEPQFCLGHSLGEYAALCAGKAVSFTDVLEIVRQRGNVIREASSMCNGTMMWVVNLTCEEVQEVCSRVWEDGQKVYISAYDSPTQCSISGHNESILNAARALETKGAIVYPLEFTGPFHCPLMENAYRKMVDILKDYTIKNPIYKVVSNLRAEPYKDAEEIEKFLPKQLIYPIKWQQSIEYLVSHGVSGVIEVGPKDVLKFLIKKISPNLKVFSYNDYKFTDLIKKVFLLDDKDRVNIIERCLKAAVSTRNYNNKPGEYQKKVIEPYKKIETLYLEIVMENKTPDKNTVLDALDMILSVMEEKAVPKHIKKFKLNSILQGKVFL